MKRLSIRLLGGFEVAVDDRALPGEVWRSRRGADLVKLLALSEGHRLHRERAVEALWPHLPAAAGIANLHKAAHLARKAIGERDAVALRAGQAMLAPGSVVETDVERFDAAGDPDLYGGELLPDDRYEEWASEPRERLRTRYLEALRAAGRFEELAREEPADEPAQLALIEDLAERGDRHGALDRYRRLRDALGARGMRPSAEAAALLERISAGEPAAAPLAASRPIVGREEEVGELRALLERCLAGGRGAAVLVSGEAGIGKTRLCEELLRIAAERGMTTLRGAAGEAEGAVPYAPVVEALDALLIERPDLTGDLTEGARSELRRLSVAAPGPAPEPAGAPDRQRIFSAVGQLLAAAARGRGAAILIDDMHMADDATVQLVGYLARAATFQPLVVALAFRDGAVRPALAELRESLLERGATARLPLAPLARPAADALVADVGETACSPEASEAIWRLAEGNPFFTEELAGSIDSQGRPRVPGRLYEVLHARLARLEPGQRRALTRIAVAADELEADEVAALTDLPEEDALAVIDGGLAAGLLRESGRRYRFRHALVREALLHGIPSHRLAAEHRAVAERLARSGAAPARVADHLLRGERPAEAVGWLTRAARQAAAVAAYSDALALATAALEHASEGERAELLPLRADLLVATGDRLGAMAYSEAIAAAGKEREVELRAKQARALLLAGDVAAAGGALEGLQASTGSDAARLAAARALATWFQGDLEEARRQADSARSLAIEAGLEEETVEATALRAAVAHTAGDWPGRVRFELTDTLARPELAQTVFDALHCTAEYVLAGGGPYEPLATATGELRATAGRSGARRAEAFAATVLGEARLLAGDLEGATEELTAAVELNGRVGAVCGQALAHSRLGQATVAYGRAAEAAELFSEALSFARWSPLANHLLYIVYEAMLRAAPGPEQAVALLDREQASLEGHRACPFCGAGFQAAAAVACAESGDVPRARGFLAVAEAGTAFWGGGPHAAAVAEAGAAVALAEGAAEDAVASLREAAAGFAAAGQPLNEARARARLAALA